MPFLPKTGSPASFWPLGAPPLWVARADSTMAFSYKISTLLYCFNRLGQVLLLERANEPNRGLWSPCGGKLITELGESPYTCACREAQEEIGLELTPSNLHLAGLVSEHGYEGQSHWLMFLFEVLPPLEALPPPHREGRFAFFAPETLAGLKLPQTDRDRLWPWFWQFRGGFFAAHCHCHADGRYEWTLEESAKVLSPRSSVPGGNQWIESSLPLGREQRNGGRG